MGPVPPGREGKTGTKPDYKGLDHAIGERKFSAAMVRIRVRVIGFWPKGYFPGWIGPMLSIRVLRSRLKCLFHCVERVRH